MKNILSLGILVVLASGSVAAAQQAVAAPSAVSLATFRGTYKFQSVGLQDISVMVNPLGQQVGFCNWVYVQGYSCWDYYTFELFTGTISADGRGNFTGTITLTEDINGHKCSPKNNPTKPCPVMVPSGNPFDMTGFTQYNVGAVVDFTYPGTNQTKTFQAVKTNIGKPPNWVDTSNVCRSSDISNCYWMEIPESLNNSKPQVFSGAVTGTYTIQTDGSGTITMTIGGCNDCGQVRTAFTISPVNEIGQTMSLAGISDLGHENTMVGSGVKIR